jgi:hypothetical protein
MAFLVESLRHATLKLFGRDSGPDDQEEDESSKPAMEGGEMSRMLTELARNTFIRELPRLLREHRGKHVAYHGERLVAIGSPQEVLLAWMNENLPEDEMYMEWVAPNPISEDTALETARALAAALRGQPK